MSCSISNLFEVSLGEEHLLQFLSSIFRVVKQQNSLTGEDLVAVKPLVYKRGHISIFSELGAMTIFSGI